MKTKLIALVAILAGMLAAYPDGLEVGAAFELEPADAEPLLTSGQARLAEDSLTGTGAAPAPAPVRSRTMQARLLQDCEHGKANDLVTLPSAVAKAAVGAGVADCDADAVAYAKTLEQNSRKADA